MVRVSEPRICTLMQRGTWPTGTWSGNSCSLADWNLQNLVPRVCVVSMGNGSELVWDGAMVIKAGNPHLHK